MPESDVQPPHDGSWRGTTTNGSVAMLALIGRIRERIELLEMQMDAVLRDRGIQYQAEGVDAVGATVIPVRRVKRQALPPPPGARAPSPETGPRDGESIDIRLAVLRCDTCTMEYPLSKDKAAASLHNHTVRKHQRVPTPAERTPRKPR